MPAAALALVAGALTVLGFAPFGAALLPVVTLAVLFALWRDAPTPRRAAVTGFAFGLGLFGAGVPWIGIALVSFGGMPLPVAVVGLGLAWCVLVLLYRGEFRRERLPAPPCAGPGRGGTCRANRRHVGCGASLPSRHARARSRHAFRHLS